MKTILVRTFTVALLLASVSAFSAAGEIKNENAAGPCATTKQDGSSQGGAALNKEKKSKKDHKDEQKDSDPLLGIYG